MKISHIVPVDLLYLIENRDFYMCLANVAYKNQQYKDFYKRKREEGAFVLLDNGAAENDQMSLNVMWDIISYINPNEVILSDSLLNKDETLIKSKQSLEFYQNKGYKGRYMFVPQGKDFKDWTQCYHQFDKSNISTIGLSKFITSGWNEKDARYDCCLYLTMHKNDKDVHLLGCHKEIKEEKYIKEDFNFIRSADSAIAYIYSLNNQLINKGIRPKNKEIDFLKNQLDEEQIKLLERNIKIYDKLS